VGARGEKKALLFFLPIKKKEKGRKESFQTIRCWGGGEKKSLCREKEGDKGKAVFHAIPTFAAKEKKGKVELINYKKKNPPQEVERKNHNFFFFPIYI